MLEDSIISTFKTLPRFTYHHQCHKICQPGLASWLQNISLNTEYPTSGQKLLPGDFSSKARATGKVWEPDLFRRREANWKNVVVVLVMVVVVVALKVVVIVVVAVVVAAAQIY